MDLIELQDNHKTYHLGEVDLPVLRGVSPNVEHGELVALMGASSSGKSTLINIILMTFEGIQLTYASGNGVPLEIVSKGNSPALVVHHRNNAIFQRALG